MINSMQVRLVICRRAGASSAELLCSRVPLCG